MSGTALGPEDDLTLGGPTPDITDLTLLEFNLPPPKDLSESDRKNLIHGSISRIWDGAEELRAMGESIAPESAQAGGNSAAEMWMLLLLRMITRVAEPPADLDDSMGDASKEVVVQDFYLRQDQLRQTLCDYIMSDFPSR